MFEEEICFVCGINSDFEPLFEAISDEEIVLVCQDCSIKENLPLVKKPTEEQIKESKTPYSRREVFARISGPLAKKIPEKQKLPEKVTLDYLQERMLRQREAARNMEQLPINLIENFHWSIYRARRLAKITIKELAEKLKESEASIKMLEEGKIPRGVESLIKKLEQFFNIQLVKAPLKPMIGLRHVEIPSSIKQEVKQVESQKTWQETKPTEQKLKEQKTTEPPKPPLQTLRELREKPKFSPEKLKNITIDDLVKMKKEKECKKV